SRDPSTGINRVPMTPVRARKHAEVGENTILPTKGMADKAVGVVTIWCIGISRSCFRRASNHSCIVEELASGTISRPMSGRATQGADVDESVSSVLGRHLNRQRQRGK